MKYLAGLFMSLLVAGAILAPDSAARAAVVPGLTAVGEAGVLTDTVRWRGRGYHGPRFHGPRFYGPRMHRRHVGVYRHQWRPRRVRPIFVYQPYPAYRYSCIRRGWVWNGWRHVWRRYRVC